MAKAGTATTLDTAVRIVATDMRMDTMVLGVKSVKEVEQDTVEEKKKS